MLLSCFSSSLLCLMALASCCQVGEALSLPDASSSSSSSDSGYSTKSVGGSGLNDVSGGSPHQVNNKFLPDGISRTDKQRIFIECRRECIAKCDRLVYVYSTKKEFCHDCIRQCITAMLQQARALGIDLISQDADRMLGDSPGPLSADDEKRRRRRNRNGRDKRKEKKNRRERRQRKEQLRQQQLLKNCIVH